MYRVPVIERVNEYDFRGIPLSQLDRQLSEEGYPGCDILAAICIFNIQDTAIRQKRFGQAKQYFEKHPAKAEEMATYLLQRYGQTDQYQIISQAAVRFMTSGTKHRASNRHGSKARFVIPLRTTLIILALAMLLIFYFELNALLIYAIPVLYVLIFNLIRWLVKRKTPSETKQKILYPI